MHKGWRPSFSPSPLFFVNNNSLCWCSLSLSCFLRTFPTDRGRPPTPSSSFPIPITLLCSPKADYMMPPGKRREERNAPPPPLNFPQNNWRKIDSYFAPSSYAQKKLAYSYRICGSVSNTSTAKNIAPLTNISCHQWQEDSGGNATRGGKLTVHFPGPVFAVPSSKVTIHSLSPTTETILGIVWVATKVTHS